MPDSIFNNSEFKQAENTYLSSNGELATINVTLKENPYTNGAMEQIPVLNNIVKNSIIGTNLSNAKIGESGLISINYNTRSMANHDYNEVVVLVSIGVLIVLILLLRSIIMSTYITFNYINLLYCNRNSSINFPKDFWICRIKLDYFIFWFCRFSFLRNRLFHIYNY